MKRTIGERIALLPVAFLYLTVVWFPCLLPSSMTGARGLIINLMGLCSLNPTFFTAGERITFGGADDRAAVDQGPRAQG